MAVYQFKCYCEVSYIGLTSQQLRKGILEHIPKCVQNYLASTEKESVQIINDIKNRQMLNTW